MVEVNFVLHSTIQSSRIDPSFGVQLIKYLNSKYTLKWIWIGTRPNPLETRQKTWMECI